MKPKLKPISNQVVVLLGATSGIGLQTAKMMAAKGAQVVIVGRNQDGLNDATEKITRHLNETSRMVMTEPIVALEADVTQFEQVKSVADQVVQRFGRIDTWVNVAAVAEWALFEDTSPDEFHRIIEVNLLGQAYGAMAALPYLKQQQGGALIFIASVAGRMPIPYQSAYNASKHGVMGLVDTLRLELKHSDVPVSVTAILPASINTPLFDKARTKIGVEPYPIPPIYDVKMVAKAIIYAAQHPVRELIVGDSGYMMTFMRRLAPTLSVNAMGASGFRAQRSDEPKSAQAPDNLYHHINGFEESQGDYTTETKRFSPLTWLSTHPKARMALYGGLLAGVGAYVGYRVITQRNRQMGWRYALPRQVAQVRRDAARQTVKTSQQTLKATRKAIKGASETFTNLPVVSSLPMFHKRTLLERAGEMMLGWWAAITSISLPFISRRRKSLPRRVVSSISDRLPEVSLPWNRQPTMIERLTLAEQRKAAAQRFGKMSDKVLSQVMDQVDDTRQRAARVVSQTADQVDDRSEKAQKAYRKAAEKTVSQVDKQVKAAKKAAKVAAHAMPSLNDIKEADEKDQVVVRRQSLIEKLPFGERRETIVERMPINK